MPPMCDYVSDGRLSSLVTASPKDLSQESSSDEEGSSRRINGSIIDRFKISWICFKRFDKAKACWSLGVHTSWGPAFLEANLPWGWRLDVYLMCIICEICRNLLFVCYCYISSWCLSSQYIYIGTYLWYVYIICDIYECDIYIYTYVYNMWYIYIYVIYIYIDTYYYYYIYIWYIYVIHIICICVIHIYIYNMYHIYI